MMRRLMSVAAAAFLATAGVTFAHEGHAHKMMGTVKAVHVAMNHVEITVKGGKTDGFYVNPATKYLKGTTALGLADLKPGMRVVVDARMEGNKMLATQVRIGATRAAAPPAAPPPK